MIKKEINGKNVYCFEDHEGEARKLFEKSMVGEDAVEKIMMALLDACSEMTIRKKQAWELAQEQLTSEFPELSTEIQLQYDWLKGGFKVMETK